MIICICSALLLAVWIFTFPSFFNWFYVEYHNLNSADEGVKAVIKTVIISFYSSAPFAGISLYMLIRLLVNIINDSIFVMKNVLYMRGVSYCCFAVALVNLIFGIGYFPLLIIFFATAVVGILLRVLKNVMQSAVEIKQENELTI